MFRAQNSEWLQNALNVLIGLFCKYRLITNVPKSRTIIFQSGALQSIMSEEAVRGWYMGVGESYCEQLRRHTPCPECGVELTHGPITTHQRRMYGTYPGINWNCLLVSQTKHLPQVCNARFPKGTTRCPGPFPGCPESYCAWNGLQNNFDWKHWVDSIRIFEDHPSPFPKCDRWVIQVPLWSINSQHY